MDLLPVYSLFFGIPMVATIPVTMFLCRRRLARQKRISYGTMFASALCVPFAMAFIATCFEPDIWFTREHKNDPSVWPVMLFFMVAMCVLPALGVVVYYQRRKKRDERPVA
jgi:O-antigen/teichoic acid export membrane protein